MLVYLKRLIKFILISLILFCLINTAINFSLNYKYSNLNTSSESKIIDNIPINYYQEGTGFPLLIIQDLAEANNNFDLLKKDLTLKHTVVSVNINESLKHFPGNYTLEDLSQFIITFMNSLGHNNFNILASSSGSKIALNISNLHSDKINRIILLNPVEYVVKPIMINNYLYQRFVYSKGFSNKSKINTTIFDYQYYLLNKCGQDNLNTYSTVLNTNYFKLDNITAPTLILSNKNNLLYGENLKEKIKNSSLIELLNTGDYPHIESTKLIINELNKFLQ